MSAVDICYARLSRPGGEEGRRSRAYNDATGETVSCRPNGNLSIAVGVNLEVGLDDEEIDWLSKRRLQRVADALQPFAWYKALDDTRASVVLDVAFNQGVSGLMHYPHMIAALAKQDWATAAAECAVADPKLDASRYAPLRQLLLSGSG